MHFLVQLIPFVDPVPIYDVPVAIGQDAPKIIGTCREQMRGEEGQDKESSWLGG